MKKVCLPAALAALSLAIGCSSSTTTGGGEKKAAPAPAKKNHHGDHEPGPHHGTVFDWGPYHMELVVDHGKKEARVYVLDDDEKSPRPIASPGLVLSIKEPKFQVDLKPERQPKDPEGKASCFVGTHEKLAEKRDFEGSVEGLADGKKWTGDFKEEDDHHDHGKK